MSWAPELLQTNSNRAAISHSPVPARVARIISVMALTPMRPALRIMAISAGDLIVRRSQMAGEQSLTAAAGKRSRRSLTNSSSRGRRPSQRLRVMERWSVPAFSDDTSRMSSSGLKGV